MAKARDSAPEPGEDGDESARAGLCATCRHGARQESARSSVFWRCRRADEDPAYPRYPPLPVLRCPGHAPAGR